MVDRCSRVLDRCGEVGSCTGRRTDLAVALVDKVDWEAVRLVGKVDLVLGLTVLVVAHMVALGMGNSN